MHRTGLRLADGVEHFLGGLDLDAAQFDPCCTNQDLCVIRCPRCRYLMGFCRECDTLFPDLTVPMSSLPVRLTDAARDRIVCGGCEQPFPEFFILTPANRHRYLVDDAEFRARGFGHLLVARRERSDPAP